MGRFKRNSSSLMSSNRRRITKPRLSGYPIITFMKEIGVNRLGAIIQKCPTQQILVNHKGLQVTPAKPRTVHSVVRYTYKRDENGNLVRVILSEKKKKKPMISLAYVSLEDLSQLFPLQEIKFQRMFKTTFEKVIHES